MAFNQNLPLYVSGASFATSLATAIYLNSKLSGVSSELEQTNQRLSVTIKKVGELENENISTEQLSAIKRDVMALAQAFRMLNELGNDTNAVIHQIRNVVADLEEYMVTLSSQVDFLTKTNLMNFEAIKELQGKAISNGWSLKQDFRKLKLDQPFIPSPNRVDDREEYLSDYSQYPGQNLSRNSQSYPEQSKFGPRGPESRSNRNFYSNVPPQQSFIAHNKFGPNDHQIQANHRNNVRYNDLNRPQAPYHMSANPPVVKHQPTSILKTAQPKSDSDNVKHVHFAPQYSGNPNLLMSGRPHNHWYPDQYYSAYNYSHNHHMDRRNLFPQYRPHNIPMHPSYINRLPVEEDHFNHYSFDSYSDDNFINHEPNQHNTPNDSPLNLPPRTTQTKRESTNHPEPTTDSNDISFMPDDDFSESDNQVNNYDNDLSNQILARAQNNN